MIETCRDGLKNLIHEGMIDFIACMNRMKVLMAGCRGALQACNNASAEE